MIRDRFKGLFGQEDDEIEEDQHFEDVTKVEISDAQGYGYSRNFTIVTVTEGYGPKAEKSNLHNINRVYFEKGKFDWISVDSSIGTTVNMSSSKGVIAIYDVEEGELRVG